MKTTIFISIILFIVGCTPAKQELQVGYDDLLTPAHSICISAYEVQEVDGTFERKHPTPLLETRVYYDSHGYRTKQVNIFEQDSLTTQRYTYDKEYRLLKYVFENDKIEEAMDQLAKDIDRIKLRSELRDKQGNLLMVHFFYQEKQLSVTTLANERGIPILKKFYNPLRQLDKVIHSDQEGNPLHTEQFVYEGKFLVSHVTKGEEDSLVTSYQYTEFDEQGNWTQRLKKVDGKVAELQLREIQYTPPATE